ncbi:MAG TPA: glycoside hydrolase family 18 protein [Chloroflexota bacterium]|nr:glycoside hydrolase family 18 protein [Chloroflexota bacterium]
MRSALSRPAAALAVLLVAMAAMAGVVRGCVLRPAAALPGSHYNVGANAAWLGIEWVNEAHGEVEIAALAAQLRAHQIADAYVYVSYLRPSGQFGETFAHARAFTRAMNAAGPEIRLQAWRGVPLRVGGGAMAGGPGHADLGDASTRGTIAAFAARVVRDAGFDGVHLDPEPAAEGDPHLLALLEEVRAAVGRDAFLSIATPRIRPLLWEAGMPAVGPLFWSGAYYREVARRVDQVALMTYDSALPVPWLYRQWGRFQVIALSRALEGAGADVLVGVPTSRERTFTHVPSAESMSSGLLGTIDGLNDAAARPRAITGVAVYPHWETTEEDWRTYRRLWLGAD